MASQQQIIAIANQIVNDLDPKGLGFDTVEHATFNPNYNAIYGIENSKKQPMSCWIVSIKNAFGRIDFLVISDETGEPLHYQNSSTAMLRVEKGEDGKYNLVPFLPGLILNFTRRTHRIWLKNRLS